MHFWLCETFMLTLFEYSMYDQSITAFGLTM
jgi:hypothetical protein